jgi:hypothetical protein
MISITTNTIVLHGYLHFHYNDHENLSCGLQCFFIKDQGFETWHFNLNLVSRIGKTFNLKTVVLETVFLLMNGSLTCWILSFVHFQGLTRIE